MSTARRASEMTEAQLDAAVADLCKLLGLLTYHTFDSRRSQAGYPDRTTVGPGGALFRELKSRTGKVTAEQWMWLDRMRAAGLDADVWRPEDWRSGRIAKELQAIRRVPPRTITITDLSEVPDAAEV